MSDQDQQISNETNANASGEPNIESSTEQQTSENAETKTKSIEETSSRRMMMPQDVRYSIEQSDQEKLIQKYENYQISDVNACNIRFLIDHQQKIILFGRNEEEEQETFQSLTKTFAVHLFPGYQRSSKHSYKLSGIESHVRQCLIEIIKRLFKSSTEETTTEEKNEENVEKEETKFVPIQCKSEHTLIMLITNQGQEVLKKNWNFFGGTLQQRLELTISNPTRLLKFGDKQVHNELSLTGESVENLADAVLQITAFINDVLGVPVQLYKGREQFDQQTSEERTEHENIDVQRRKSNKIPQRSTGTQNQSNGTMNNFSERTFFNRNRNEICEEKILIRTDCVPRIVGKRGNNLKLIKSKCYLRDFNIERQENEKGYTECTLTSNQPRNLQSAIEMIRSFLRNEDQNSVIVVQSDQNDLSKMTNSTFSSSFQTNSPFNTKSFHIRTGNNYPHSSYNFQNTPSFDFTHQATAASRKTDKRPGDLTENSSHMPTSNEIHDVHHIHSSSSTSPSISPRHRSKRSCPETKEIDCTTDEGFWIQRQYYQELDQDSKETFDSLMEKLEKIRIAAEENALRKHQRLAGRNRITKTRNHPSTVSYLNDENIRTENESENKSISIEENVKVEKISNQSEEKENQENN